LCADFGALAEICYPSSERLARGANRGTRGQPFASENLEYRFDKAAQFLAQITLQEA
jgi:hypothetical protein